MKRLLILISAMMVWGICFATDYTQDSRCVGAWLFTDGSGAKLSVASPVGSSGTITNAVWSSTVPASFTPYSLFFDGNGDKVTLADPAITSSFTFVFWFKGGNSTGDGKHIWSFFPGAFVSFSGTASMRAGVTTTGSAYAVFDSPANLGTAWHHIAVTYNNANITTYVDGVQKNQTPKTGNIDTSGDFNIGNYYASDLCVYGWISEGANFNQALSQTEIQDIMTNGLKGSGSSTTAVQRGIMVVINDD